MLTTTSIARTLSEKLLLMQSRTLSTDRKKFSHANLESLESSMCFLDSGNLREVITFDHIYLISECKELLLQMPSVFHAVLSVCERESKKTLHVFDTVIALAPTTNIRLRLCDIQFMVRQDGRAFPKETEEQGFTNILYCSTIVPAPKYGVKWMFSCDFTLKYTKYTITET